MPTIFFPKQGVFDPEATAAMGEAFDAACKELRCTTQPEVIRELIATLIIAAASRGELDPVRLRMVAVAGFAPPVNGGASHNVCHWVGALGSRLATSKFIRLVRS
jgi:hypothetical protein